MLQAALGGNLVVGSSDSFIDNPVYYEPGFNIMYPLEIVSSEADKLYILIRKRADDTGLIFDNMDPSKVSVTATDTTNGEALVTRVSSNNTYEPWTDSPSASIPIVVEIENQLDIISPILRVRVIDCFVKETTTTNFIQFRITVDDSGLFFHYIPVNRKFLSDRNDFTIASRQAKVVLNSSSDTYILFSPYAWLKETTKGKEDFSYPEDSIHYQRQNTYNKEDFIFSVSSYSHTFVSEQISVMNVPSYGKVGIVTVDSMLYRHLKEQGRSAYVDISVVGELSGITDTFRVNFST